jgi:hypothetical protein
MENTTTSQSLTFFGAGVRILYAVADAIRELGSVPSGVLYAQLMGKIDLQTYERIIDLLKGAGLVKESSHELIWIGPGCAPTPLNDIKAVR